MKALIAVAAVAALGLLIVLLIRRTRSGGCCGTQVETARKIRPTDRNPAHYAHHYTATVEGMVCAGCVRTVENAFNAHDGVCAVVDLGTRKARIHSKAPLDRRSAADLLTGTSYIISDFREERI